MNVATPHKPLALQDYKVLKFCLGAEPGSTITLHPAAATAHIANGALECTNNTLKTPQKSKKS